MKYCVPNTAKHSICVNYHIVENPKGNPKYIHGINKKPEVREFTEKNTQVILEFERRFSRDQSISSYLSMKHNGCYLYC